ncbi:MAG: serine hydrolase [Flavisolibacter sp.]
MKTLIAILLIFLLLTSAVSGQALSSHQIDSLAEKTLKMFDVPGLAIAVIKDGNIIHEKGYGVRSLNTREPVDENTLFGIASNTKAFTATALGILVDEKKIHWDDKVTHILPEFRLYDPWVTKEFTIRDLLTHRSGLGLGAGDLMRFPDSSDFSTGEIIHNLRYFKPVSSFRSTYAYDNSLYLVAGEIVSRVSGKSWDDFVEERIMAPLNMTRSAGAYSRLKEKTNVIDAHAVIEDTLRVIARRNSKIGHAAGGVYASVRDLGKWILFQLAHGKYGDHLEKQLISEKVHEETWSPQTILPLPSPNPYNSHFAAYGLGFLLNDVMGRKQISHTGFNEGMVSQITMIPEMNLGIIILTNQEDTYAYTALTNQIKDAYLKIKGNDWITTLSAQRKKLRAEEKRLTDSIWKEIAQIQKFHTDAENLLPYTGTYHDKWFGNVLVSLNKGRLWFAAQRSPKLTGELFYYKKNSFIVKWRNKSMNADAFLNFASGREGSILGITMKPVSPFTDFSYDFQDLNLKKIK